MSRSRPVSATDRRNQQPALPTTRHCFKPSELEPHGPETASTCLPEARDGRCLRSRSHRFRRCHRK
eukprot:1357162-Alexandrium_andersonii.AAC.1